MLERSSNPNQEDNFEQRIEARNRYFLLTNDYAKKTGSSIHDLIVSDFRAFLREIVSTDVVRDLRTYEFETPWGILKHNALTGKATTPVPHEHEVRLSRLQSQTLEILMQRPLAIHGLNELRGNDSEFRANRYKIAADGTVRVNISYLRGRLGHTEQTPLIHTVKGKGYTLNPNIEQII